MVSPLAGGPVGWRSFLNPHILSSLASHAGSERQRQSGATGERLKEASGINVSLTVLGQVIMSLVDVQHGRRQHVPYRNSRLTFLLQVPPAVDMFVQCHGLL